MLVVALAAILGISLLAACGGGAGTKAEADANFVGKWVMVEATGDEDFVGGIAMLEELGGSMILNINEGGDALMVIEEPTGMIDTTDSTSDGTWEATGADKIKIEFSDGSTGLGTLKDGRLSFDVDNVTLHFEREGA